MSDGDPVDDHSEIFTEAEVFMIAGFLAERWEVEGSVVFDTEEAITAVLAECYQ